MVGKAKAIKFTNTPVLLLFRVRVVVVLIIVMVGVALAMAADDIGLKDREYCNANHAQAVNACLEARTYYQKLIDATSRDELPKGCPMETYLNSSGTPICSDKV